MNRKNKTKKKNEIQIIINFMFSSNKKYALTNFNQLSDVNDVKSKDIFEGFDAI